MTEGLKCVFLHLNLPVHKAVALFRTVFQLESSTPSQSISCKHLLCSDTLLPSDMSSSSRRLIPISCEGALRLSVGVGNSGNDGGDCGDVSSPVRSSSAVPPPVHIKQTKTKNRNI